MSAKLLWSIEEAGQNDLPDELGTEAKRLLDALNNASIQASRAEQRPDDEHQTSRMLLEAVACLRELSEIVLRHERMLTIRGRSDAELADSSIRAASAPRASQGPYSSDGDDLPESTDAPVLGVGNQTGLSDPASPAKRLPPAISFLLSASASVSGLVLAYTLFLR